MDQNAGEDGVKERIRYGLSGLVQDTATDTRQPYEERTYVVGHKQSSVVHTVCAIHNCLRRHSTASSGYNNNKHDASVALW